MSWFFHQLALLLSVPNTCFKLLLDLFHPSSNVFVWLSHLVVFCQMPLCSQWSTDISFFVLPGLVQSYFKSKDWTCCTFSLLTVPLLFLVWFCFRLTSWSFLEVWWWYDSSNYSLCAIHTLLPLVSFGSAINMDLGMSGGIWPES